MTRRLGLGALWLVLGCATQPPPAQRCPEPAEPPPATTPAPVDSPNPAKAPARPDGFRAGQPPGEWDAKKLAAFRRRAKEEGTTSLLVAVDGALVIEDYFDSDPQRATIAMSVTKSIMALAFGALYDAGRLQLDKPLSETLVPEWKGTNKASITLRHVLTHRSGLSTERYASKKDQWAKGSIERTGLDSKLIAKVGSKFQYNNNMTDFAAVLARRAEPEQLYLDDLLQVRIFSQLGVTGAFWLKDGHGQPRGAGELFLRPIDLLKLGQLVLNRGKWRGQQVVSSDWIDQMTTSDPVAPYYGLLWWLSGDAQRVLAYRADGYLGQYIVVIPDKRVVAVRTRDPRIRGWDAKQFSWKSFHWDLLALAGHPVAEQDLNGFARTPTD